MDVWKFGSVAARTLSFRPKWRNLENLYACKDLSTTVEMTVVIMCVSLINIGNCMARRRNVGGLIIIATGGSARG